MRHFVPLPCPLPPTEQSILCKLHPMVWSGRLQLGEKWLFPPIQPYPHHRKKKGLMIAVSLTFLFCLVEVLRGESRNLYKLMLLFKVLTEQNCLQDHTAEKHREGRVGERNKTPSPLACHPLFPVQFCALAISLFCLDGCHAGRSLSLLHVVPGEVSVVPKHPSQHLPVLVCCMVPTWRDTCQQ